MGFVEKYADSGVMVIGAHFAGPTAGHITPTAKATCGSTGSGL